MRRLMTLCYGGIGLLIMLFHHACFFFFFFFFFYFFLIFIVFACKFVVSLSACARSARLAGWLG